MTSLAKSFQLTLAILKPDVLANPIVLESIKEIILKERFLVVQSIITKLTSSQTELFYIDHKEKFFYSRLVNYMSCGPLMACILHKEDCVKNWRELLGPTKVYRTIFEQPNSIRGSFGMTDTRNSAHGSDSEDSVRKEVAFFFPGFNIDKFLSSKNSYNNYQFNKKKFLHELKNN